MVINNRIAVAGITMRATNPLPIRRRGFSRALLAVELEKPLNNKNKIRAVIIKARSL